MTPQHIHSFITCSPGHAWKNAKTNVSSYAGHHPGICGSCPYPDPSSSHGHGHGGARDHALYPDNSDHLSYSYLRLHVACVLNGDRQTSSYHAARTRSFVSRIGHCHRRSRSHASDIPGLDNYPYPYPYPYHGRSFPDCDRVFLSTHPRRFSWIWYLFAELEAPLP